MGFVSKSGTAGININQFEYAYAVEAFDPEAEEIKVYVPKLMGEIPASPKTSKSTIDGSVFCNGASCKATSAPSVQSQGYILAKVVDKIYHNHPHLQCNNRDYGTDNCPNRSHTNTCHHAGSSILAPCFHDHWHFHFDNEQFGGGLIPAGTKLIVMFMDNDISDCWVTRFICRKDGYKQRSRNGISMV